MSCFVIPEIDDDDDFDAKSIQNWRARSCHYCERFGKDGVNLSLSKTTKLTSKATARYVDYKAKNRGSQSLCKKRSTTHSTQKGKSPSRQSTPDSGISITLSGGSDCDGSKSELEIAVRAGNQSSPVNHEPLNSPALSECDDTERTLTENSKRVLFSASLAADESLQPTYNEPPSAIEPRKTTGSTLKTLHTGDKRKHGDTGSFVVPCKKQASLLSFLSSPKQCREELKNADCSTSSVCGRTTTSTLSRNESPHDYESGYSQVSVLPFHGAQHERGVFKRRPSRTCPFYKRVPDLVTRYENEIMERGFLLPTFVDVSTNETNMVVDAFQYGAISGCSVYFLSHFHSDHYQGLNRHFKHTVFCSQVTASLVKQCLKLPVQYVHVLPLNKPVMIQGVEVTLLDANHCPGSVMLFFKLPSGRTYLHTGDFRFTSAMESYPQLTDNIIHQLFLDTTYCSPRYDFPDQQSVVQFAVQKALAAVRSNPNTLIVCGTYTIGKEKVFLAIADALGSKVCVSKDKKAVLDCLESEWITQTITTDPHLASVHVLPIGKLNTEGLSAYLDAWKSKYSAVLAFKPTGWTHSQGLLSLASIRPQGRGPVTLYGIPYSEHSSFSELRQFVQFLRPKKIIPTVNNHSASKRAEMQRHFQTWLSESGSSVPAVKQTTLDCAFSKS